MPILPAFLIVAAVAPPAESWAFSEHWEAKGALAKPMLDLRGMNEKVAGETGFVRAAPDGRGFVRGDGKPIRFWSVNASGWKLKPEEMADNARFLAKMGVNMVRIHGSISPKGPGKTLADWDREEVDGIQRYVAALKKEGIYVTISPFWANAGHSGASASWGLGYGDGEDVWGLIFFDDRLKNAYKGWVRKLYAEPNPYTGIPLAKDPAVAIAQVQNEDSLLFWTFQGIKPAAKAILAKKFDAWLLGKYGKAAKARWQGAGGDAPFLETWVLTQPQTGGMKVRADDQMAFLIDQQRAFYTDMGDFYRKELGFGGLMNGSNWITADPVRQNDAERFTNATLDVMAVNRYFNGVHKGPNEGWRIDEGDFFTEDSVLTQPRALPINVKQVVGKPTIITESTWVTPLSYQAEGPLLISAYSSLTGVEGIDWFAFGGPRYTPESFFPYFSFPDGERPLSKWDGAIPSILGGFPAAATLYRNGYLRRGATVVSEVRTRAALDAREIPLIAESTTYDPNRPGGDDRAGRSEAKAANPLSYLVGPVETRYDGNPSDSRVADTSKFIGDGTIRSNTGEIALDSVTGLLKVDAPNAQAVAGFLRRAGGKFALADATIRSDMDYASIMLVSLDGLPLKTSRKVLLQIGTTSRPTGWRQEPASWKEKPDSPAVEGFKVVHTGKAPFLVAAGRGTVTVANAGLNRATLLDPSGDAAEPAAFTRGAKGITLGLPARGMYVLLEAS